MITIPFSCCSYSFLAYKETGEQNKEFEQRKQQNRIYFHQPLPKQCIGVDYSEKGVYTESKGKNLSYMDMCILKGFGQGCTSQKQQHNK
jgi:hypothetical protein